MPNSYVNLNTLKDAGMLGLTATTNDTQLLRVAEEASRNFDKDTDRFFFIYEGTMYQDGGAIRVVLDFDVQSVTTLKLDPDGDGVYDTTVNLATTPADAFLYPQNITPKTRIEVNPWGSVGHLAPGIRNGIQITGVFGHGNDWPNDYKHSAAVTVGGALSSTDSTVSLSGNTTSEIAAGMTLRINSEQVYVAGLPTGTNNSTCPITRAVNGTSAAAATTSTAINIYDYPASVVQAVLIETVRTWKRRESGYVNTIINTDMGTVQVFKGRDPDYDKIVKKYKRERQPRYIN